MWKTLTRIETIWSLGTHIWAFGGGAIVTAIAAFFSPLWTYTGLAGFVVLFLLAVGSIAWVRNTVLHGYSLKPVSVEAVITDNKSVLNRYNSCKGCDLYISAFYADSNKVLFHIFFHQKMKVHSPDMYYADDRGAIDYEEAYRGERGIILRANNVAPNKPIHIEIRPDKRIY